MFVFDYYIGKRYGENIHEGSGLIAESEEHAMKLLEEDFDLIGRLQTHPVRRNQKKDMYRLSLYRRGDIAKYLQDQLEKKNCKKCKRDFRKNNNRKFVQVDDDLYCSVECYQIDRNTTYEYMSSTDYGVIYKITQKSTGMCYIGQTTRSWTLRRWEHFTHGTENKFHTAIRNSDLSDRTFEIIEKIEKYSVINNKNIIDELEQKRIKYYDSVTNGFNTIGFKSIKEPDDHMFI